MALPPVHLSCQLAKARAAWTSFLRAHRSAPPGRNVVVTGSAVFRVSKLLHFSGHHSLSAGVGWYRTSYVPCPFGFYLPRRDSAGRHQNAKLCLNRCLSCKHESSRRRGKLARWLEWCTKSECWNGISVRLKPE